ncbi:hypothetical protein [Larkinella soli]|uniref:hypothetical protein n=1 Tax=Larkinella soli TaxID=1770527 RepID=UPI000FFC2AC7|nr:hypothetical protein [Larkinella soli]
MEIDSQLIPDDPHLAMRQADLLKRITDQHTPPVLDYKHPDNAVDSLRKQYRKNRVAMQLEGLPVTDETTTYDYWSFYEALQEKYKPVR